MDALAIKFTILKELYQNEKITPKDESIRLYKTLGGFIGGVSELQVESLLRKLEKDDGIIKIERYPESSRFSTHDYLREFSQERDYYRITLLPGFEEYYKATKKKHLERLPEETKNKINSEHLPKPSKPPSHDSNKTLWIEYDETTGIILNGQFLISKPRYNGINQKIFSYLYLNPNKDFSGDQLSNALGEKVIKNLNEVVREIGFEGDLRQAFFRLNKDGITFRNPVSQEMLDKIGIKYLRIKVDTNPVANGI